MADLAEGPAPSQEVLEGCLCRPQQPRPLLLGEGAEGLDAGVLAELLTELRTVDPANGLLGKGTGNKGILGVSPNSQIVSQ